MNFFRDKNRCLNYKKIHHKKIVHLFYQRYLEEIIVSHKEIKKSFYSLFDYLIIQFYSSAGYK